MGALISSIDMMGFKFEYQAKCLSEEDTQKLMLWSLSRNIRLFIIHSQNATNGGEAENTSRNVV